MKTRIWLAIAAGVIAIGVLVAGLMPPEKARGLNERNARPGPTLAPQATAMRILVVGGTSGIGLAVARLALSRGHQVTVMARHPTASVPAGVRFIAGDVLDADAVATALRDQDAVVSSVGVPPSRRPMTTFSRGMANLLTGMRASGTTRLVAVTGIGAGDSRNHGGFGYDRLFMPYLMQGMYDDKTREEAEIRASSVDWTIVRPGFLNDAPPARRYQVVQGLEGVTSGTISRSDVADFILAALEQRAYLRSTVLLTN
jgi:putative NADH-flavin reductase